MSSSENGANGVGPCADSISAPRTSASIDHVVLMLDDEQVAGLQALVALDGATRGRARTLEETAGLLMRRGLVANLQEAGLPWAPTPALVSERLEALKTEPLPAPNGATGNRSDEELSFAEQVRTSRECYEEPEQRAQLASSRRESRGKLAAAGGFAGATAVVLVGGYVGNWSWTGFESNGQLWDWLQLLLLPVAFGTVPLWMKFGDHMSRSRKFTFRLCALAFVGFVLAGYLVPLNWTGFSGNTLWNWLTLIVLPLAVITIGVWPSVRHKINSTHVALFSGLGLAWIVTLIGGYAATWQWTGYPGNTLWDWLQLLLGPLVIATVVVPAVVRWISGDVARLAGANRLANSIHGASAHPGEAAEPPRSREGSPGTPRSR